jgi:hypothetical protein
LNPLALKRVKSSVDSRWLDTLPLLKTGGSFPMVRSSSRHDIYQLWTKITPKNKMIGDQSRNLKSGDRVCWDRLWHGYRNVLERGYDFVGRRRNSAGASGGVS